MKKAILALFMTVAFVSAFSVKGNTHPTTSKGLFQFVDTSCSGAVAGFNKGIKQLIHNIQTQSNQWLVYSDLDALDGFAYHLQNLCNPEDLELTTKLEGGQTPEQQQACSNLLAMIGSLLDQNQPQTFKSGYEQGLAWSQQALGFGPNIADGCKIWVEVNAETQAEEEYDAEEEWGSGEENNEDAVLDWNLNILAQKKSHEDCDSDDAQNASDNSEVDSDNSDDQDSKDDSEDDDSDADSDEDSDDNNEEWTTKAWNNEEWATKAWDSEEEWTTKAWAHEESTLKAWDNDEEWTTKAWQSEEWALKGWDNGDWSDWKSGDQEWQTPQSDSSDQPKLSTFFYEVNPNGNTDSGNDWMNGGYQRYIPGGSGGNPGSGGNAGIPSIPSIPGNPGGAKMTFLASVGQQASGNPWMDGDYKRYYGGNDGGAPTTTFLAVKKEKKDSDDSDNDNDNPWASDYKKYYDGNGGNDGPKQGNFFYWTI